MNKKLITIAMLSICVATGCTKKVEDNWIDIGEGPEDFSSIPYRTIDLLPNGKKPGFPRTNPDLTSLTLGLQSGKLRDAWVYIQLTRCYAPHLRKELPSVMCTSANGSDVVIVGDDVIRELLLSIEQKGKVAAIKGRAIGIYADTPVVVVKQDTMKKDKETK